MSTIQNIQEEIALLPVSAQEELQVIVHQLQQKYSQQSDERRQWSDFSLQSAMQGMESDVAYSLDNIKEKW